MHKGLCLSTVVLLVGIVAFVAYSPPGLAYNSYDSGCGTIECHGNFRVGDPSPHDLHGNIVYNCTDCHTTIGDDPSLNSSGNYENYSCNGCHIVGGLRDFHVAAGLSCSPCHDSAGSITEDVIPFYYQEERSDVRDPCVVTGDFPEDVDGDGQGLDNDGDGDYDQADSDCTSTPTEKETWGTLKERYGTENDRP